MIILPLLIGLLIIFGLCSIFISNLGEITAMHQKDCRLWSYDAQGVPYYNYSQAGLQRNPLYVASEVINHFRDYKNGAADALQQLTSNANWLVSNASPHGDYSLLEYNFPLPRYKLEPPWHSAAAQARAIEGLAIANAITGNKTYLETAKSLLNSFFVEVKDGGVTHKTPHDGWWYELYAGENTKHPRVLNGMVSAILSIHNYSKFNNDADAKFLFDQGVHALKKDLHSYDDNGYSYYDIYETPALPRYHIMHVELLGSLINITHEKIFEHFYNKWKGKIISLDISPPKVNTLNLSGSGVSSIVADFSEPIDRSSVTKSSFILMKSHEHEICTAKDLVEGRVILAPNKKTAIFKPSSDLISGANYTSILTTNISDMSGNNMTSAIATRFTPL